jgi:hypothetical protein
MKQRDGARFFAIPGFARIAGGIPTPPTMTCSQQFLRRAHQNAMKGHVMVEHLAESRRELDSVEEREG